MSPADPPEQRFMQAALREAERAMQLGEVPIGAVVVVDGSIVAAAHNEVEAQKDASAHAEVLAIRRASERLGDWRLNEASLYVSLEPCTMCIGACVLSRISRLYFGAHDPRQGACGSLYNLAEHADLPHQIDLYSGLCAEESRVLLENFFSKIR